MENIIDLRTCKKGDKLISKHGLVLEYVRALCKEDYMEHEILYPNGSYGSRTHDGFTFRKKRLDSDHDIIKIIHI